MGLVRLNDGIRLGKGTSSATGRIVRQALFYMRSWRVVVKYAKLYRVYTDRSFHSWPWTLSPISFSSTFRLPANSSLGLTRKLVPLVSRTHATNYTLLKYALTRIHHRPCHFLACFLFINNARCLDAIHCLLFLSFSLSLTLSLTHTLSLPSSLLHHFLSFSLAVPFSYTLQGVLKPEDLRYELWAKLLQQYF